MKFLVDANIARFVSGKLREIGHEVIHVKDIGLERAEDSEIFALAVKENSIILTADQDFSQMLAELKANCPSIILFVGNINRRGTDQLEVILKHLPDIEERLSTGYHCVALSNKKARFRLLPIK